MYIHLIHFIRQSGTLQQDIACTSARAQAAQTDAKHTRKILNFEKEKMKMNKRDICKVYTIIYTAKSYIMYLDITQRPIYKRWPNNIGVCVCL